MMMEYEKMIRNVKREIRAKEYDFLRQNENLGSNICLLTLGGSKAYGTNVEGSDTDLRGVALNSKRDILIGRDFETVVDVETDTVVYSLGKIVDLLTNSNPNVVEMFGMPMESYLVLTEPGKLLVNNIDLFLSQRCAKSFGGYANAQLYRLKQKSVYAMSEGEYSEHIAKVLRKMKVEFEEKYKIKLDVSIVNDDLVLDGNFKSLSMKQIHEVLNSLNNTYRDYTKHSHRNKNAEVHNKINKHSMHLIRLYAMGIDLLTEGKVVTRRVKDHDLLMSIRNSEFMASNGAIKKEFFDLVRDYEERFYKAVKTTCLPKEPNLKEIEELKAAINEGVVTNGCVSYKRDASCNNDLLTYN